MAAPRRQGTNADRARALAVKVAREVARGAGKGLQAALPFLAGRVKETLSVPAPRARVQDPRTGDFFYVATVPATPGAPPRMLSGRTRSAVTYDMAPDGMSGRVGLANLPWGRQLEFGGVIRPRRARVLRFYVPVAGQTRRGRTRYTVRPVFVKSVTQPPHPFLVPTLQKYKHEAAVIVGRAVRLT